MDIQTGEEMRRVLRYKLFLVVALLVIKSSIAQDKAGVVSTDPIAENMLIYQRSVGGWPKHIGEDKIDYKKELSSAERAGLIDDKYRNDATIDNSATTKEIRYLVNAYRKTNNSEYQKAAEKGIRYLLKMQYANGGFPQFYPDSSSYRNEITYNDNAMINALNVLWDVAHRTNGFEVVDLALVKPSQTAIDKGVDCILKTQVKVNGKLTAWCAQYDRNTFKPAKARSFELVSLSGSESVGIVEFLMKIDKPSQAIVTAVNSAVEWLQSSKVNGFKYVDVVDSTKPRNRDRVLQPDASSTVWARFYDMDTNKPFFSGRDGVKKWSLSEIEHERRVGYGWYGTWPKELLEKTYPEWKQKNRL